MVSDNKEGGGSRMTQSAEQTGRVLFDLLRQWGDGLLRLQTDLPGAPALDGGILCPACKMIHGRCHEAVYPLLFLAERTGEKTYLTAAKRLFRWGENMLCADGSLRNDAKSDWRGITVFGAVALHDALYYHGALLSDEGKREWEARLARMGEWLYENLRPGRLQAYLNYYAANACAMALLGAYFRREDYRALARELAEFCFAHTSENLLLYGEGHPLDVRTAKGCLAVDAGGYNPDETLPSLTRYARTAGDMPALERCRALWKAQLLWMLPDGAWDDSVGSRAFKWSWWGSRTADGCQDALFALGKEDPVFAEAALRNAALYARCTRDGLLYGGPDYFRHGEKPCVHHTFCRAKTLAGSLNGGAYDFERVPLPVEEASGVARYDELDLLRVSFGGWLADIGGCDHLPFPGAHASGGAVSLLFHRKTGPLIACGAADYRIKEPQNQQLPSDPQSHRSACPRLEFIYENVRYGQHYDPRAEISERKDDLGVTVRVSAYLCDDRGERTPGPGECALEYAFRPDALLIRGRVPGEIAERTRYILPLIGGAVRPKLLRGTAGDGPRPFFNLNPGFAGTEYSLCPDRVGVFELLIEV